MRHEDTDRRETGDNEATPDALPGAPKNAVPTDCPGLMSQDRGRVVGHWLTRLECSTEQPPSLLNDRAAEPNSGG